MTVHEMLVLCLSLPNKTAEMVFLCPDGISDDIENAIRFGEDGDVVFGSYIHRDNYPEMFNPFATTKAALNLTHDGKPLTVETLKEILSKCPNDARVGLGSDDGKLEIVMRTGTE